MKTNLPDHLVMKPPEQIKVPPQADPSTVFNKTSFFATTTSTSYSGDELTKKNGLIKMDELIKRADGLKKPNAIRVEDTDFWMTNKIREEQAEKHAERVLSAHILPYKFPINPDKMIYPDVKNAANPLYYTTNTTYGNEQPRPHQVAEAFFPKTNKFSKSFTDARPRIQALNTSMDKEYCEPVP